MKFLLVVFAAYAAANAQGCQFYPHGEYLRFVRVSESLEVGSEVLLVEVHPPRNLSIQAVDQKEDAHFFKFKPVNKTHVSVKLAQSLENLVDNPTPQNVLKFRLVCDYEDGEDTINTYLSVTVYVEDVNDHEPTFVDSPYHINIDELTPTGLTIFRGIHAVDMDKPNTPNSEIIYSLLSGNTGGKFALEMQGQRPALVLKKPLDYDAGERQFQLIILASDRGTPSRSSSTTIGVTVSDSDDLNPRFTKDVYKTQISEFYPFSGKKIHRPLQFNPKIYAYDQDSAINATVRYDIITGNDRHLFSMDVKNGTIFLEREVDLDTLPGNIFTLQIQATQLDNPLKTGVARVEIEVVDINDNQPQFEVETYNISIVENLPNGFSVLQVIARDIDQGDNGEFVYHLMDPSQAFSVDSRSGWLTVRNQAKLDRELRPTLNMRVFAREKMPSVISPTSESFVNVEVTLLDANDNNPMFVPSNLYEFTISNVAPVGHVIGKVEALDPDLGRNGMVLYELKRGNRTSHTVPFIVHPKSGVITVADSPIATGRKALFVEASDQPANPSERRFSLAVVTIDVIVSDKINVPPDFIGAPYEFWVGDDVPIGTSVGQVRVTEAVDKSRAVFDLLHSYHEGVPFAIEEKSGTITVVDDINKYDPNVYEFEAVVTDERAAALVTNLTVHIVGTQMSNMDKPSLLEFRVRENLSGAMVGRIVVGPGKETGSRSKPLKFSILDQQDSSVFAVSQDGTLYTQRSLDREERDSYFITVVVHNGRGDRYYQVNVRVEDENDNAPTFERNWYEGRVKEDCPVDCEVRLDHKVRVTDPDRDSNADFTVTLQGDGKEIFAFTPSGELVLKGPVDREAKDLYSLMLIARDMGNMTSQVRLTVHVEDINDNSPQFVQIIIPQEENYRIIPGSHPSLQIVLGNETLVYPKRMKKREFTTLIVPETVQIGMPLFKLIALDKDVAENGTVTYGIASETYIPTAPFTTVYMTHHFAIHPMTGEVSAASVLPPETEFLTNFTATDGGGLLDWLVVRIKVEDVNNNAPVFERERYDFYVNEGNYEKYPVGRVKANDADFGTFANLTYSLLQKRENYSDLPFSVSTDGEISVNGVLDRETVSSYSFKVLAQDNGPLDKRQRSTVEVLIHVNDVNDNPPVFFAHDRVIQLSNSQSTDSFFPIEGYDSSSLVPVYVASVAENSSPGIPVARIFANDSDLPDNGNGIVLYDIVKMKNHRQLFAVDKEGIVTVTAGLDYETQAQHNLTIVASDLGHPSLSSTALLVVNVIDVPETIDDRLNPVVPVNYYEIEVEENCYIPLEMMKVNVSRHDVEYKFTLLHTEDESYFKIDQKNGSLYLMVSPDREVVHQIQTKVKVDVIKRARNLAHVIYPVYPEDTANNEVKIVVRVRDVNDNPPRFSTSGRPYVAALTTSAGYGYPILRLHAFDLDEGINADIRYQIMVRDDSEPSRFSIDPETGQIKALVTFENDAGKVFGFDVRATDRRGSDDGHSAIANVFVYVLDEQKKLVMIMGAKPLEIERNVENISQALSNITGLDVRIQKLEPHNSKDVTDVYLYAVDPLMNVIVDSDVLSHVLTMRSAEVKKAVEPFRLISFASPLNHEDDTEEYIRRRQASYNYISLSGLELATVALGCIVFLGAITSALCVACLHKRRFVGALKLKKKKKNIFSNIGVAPLSADLMFHTKEHVESKPRSLFYPNAFVEDSTDSYMSNRSECSKYRRPNRRHRHLSNCPRHHSRKRASNAERAASTAALIKSSLASVHSSGRDSGIVEHPGGCCPCGHSLTHSSGNSSHGSYEDSLKSLHHDPSHSSGSSGLMGGPSGGGMMTGISLPMDGGGGGGGGGGVCMHGPTVATSAAAIGRRRSVRAGGLVAPPYPPPAPPPVSRRPSGRNMMV